MVVCSTAHTMNVFIGGMTLAGIGAGINELTALAATSELAPKRSYVRLSQGHFPISICSTSFSSHSDCPQ
jgi:hypothetical protein